ncbi:phage tail component protein [Clostridiales bacterium oral taxon 876 str. F0540]|nr:phage tail component protein [Clostridiales bacterium oral taxon 876 str. F0540]
MWNIQELNGRLIKNTVTIGKTRSCRGSNMDTEKLSDELSYLPYFMVKDDIVVKVSEWFIKISQFSEDELLNHNLKDIFETLRIGPNFSMYNIDESMDYFLFAKDLEVKLVNVRVIDKREELILIFTEKANSNLDVKFPFISKLCRDDHEGVAIFSLPDITLLKANQTFVSFFDKPYNKKENCIGRRVSEFVTGFKGSTSEKIWNDIVKTGQTFTTDEYVFDRFERGITYWKSTLTPLYEDGKLKYCLEMTKDITEQVLQRKKIEEQAEIIKRHNEQLKLQAELLNLSSEAIFARKPDGGIIFWNKGAEELYGYSAEEAVGNVSYDMLKTVYPLDINDLEGIIKEIGIWRGIVEHTGKNGKKLMISNVHQIISMNNGENIILEINRDVTEVIKMEDEIKRQKEELQEIIENIDDAIYIYDGNKNFYLANKAGNELFKESEFESFEELNGSTPYKYYDKNGDEITKDNLVVSRVSRGEVIVNYKMTFKSSLETKHFSVNGRPIYDDSGLLKFVVICCRDITPDMEVQTQIEQNNRKLEAIIENMSDMLMVFDKNGEYILKNKAAIMEVNAKDYRMIGDSYKKGLYFDLDGNELQLDKIPAMRVLNGEKIVEQILHVKYPIEEKYIGISGAPLYDDNGKFQLGVVCMRDITETIKQSEEIRKQKDMFEAVLNTMQEATYVFDRSGKYIVTNEFAKKRMKRSFDNILDDYNASRTLDYTGREIAFEELPAYRVLRGETIKNQILNYFINGKETYVVTSGTPIYDDNGDITLGVLTTRDITNFINSEKELKAAQEQLLISEQEKRAALEKAIEMKDEFLSLISHEFRTPLNVINSAVQAINYFCRNELPDRAKKYLDMIKLNTFRQLRLVNNLLDITRADAGRIKISKRNLDIVFITKSITESVQAYACQKEINLIFTSQFKEKVIGIDDEKYERILLNLLSNAIKFTPKGKAITVNLSIRKDNVCIEVKDEGIGIPKDKKKVIFERFGQVDSSLSRRAEGTGIGLSLVKRFVDALDGNISVKSVVGEGSTFTILLPNSTIDEKESESGMLDLMDNRLVQVTDVEFSDIYL